MTEERFLESSLWRDNLRAKGGRDQRRHQRARLRHSYLGLRENIAPLLAELSRSAPEFTVHDISHVDALWETASVICGDAVEINPAEAYVLGCALAFHDAAMGLAAYPNGIVEVMGQDMWRDLVTDKLFEATGRWPNSTEIDDPPAEVHRACIIEAVRQLHAQQAASLVEQKWRLSSGTDLHLIEDTMLREAYGQLIGKLAWSHWWDVDRLPSEFRHTQGSPPWLPLDWTIDPLKLACILRLADATQLDSGRAPSFLFTLRNPQGVSRDHWRFQEHMARPHLEEDRLVYTALRAFERPDASAWWLALTYLRKVDRELQKVDELLQDLGQPRLAVRGVAHVDDSERFAEVFQVDGWRPIDANVHISAIPNYVAALGGEQLYGPTPEVAVRELIQNAQDAVVARQVLDSAFRDGEVVIALDRDGESWFLEVCDNGIGMDEDIIKRGLLDFGRSGWRTDTVRSKFVGLASGGFRPAGTFGVGFYSALMLGDTVTVTTRRYDLGPTDARRLHFKDGLGTPPLLCPPRPNAPHASHGTAVRVKLKADPTDVDGLLARSTGCELAGLVQRLVPSNSVPITTREWYDS